MDINEKLAQKIKFNKDNATIERLKLQGQIKAHTETVRTLNDLNEHSFTQEIKTLIDHLNTKLEVLKEEVLILIATERIADKMDLDFVEILSALDLQDWIKDNQPKDNVLLERQRVGICCFKTFGKVKYPCDNKSVSRGFCEEHLKIMDKVEYVKVSNV